MSSVYQADPSLVVEPHHYSGGIPVFMPTMAEFKDFYAFNKAINKYGMQSGIVKIIPPQEWKRALPKYTNKQLESIRIKNPIIQHINGVGAGVYSSQNIERTRTYSMEQWKDLSQHSNYLPPAPRGKVRETSHKNVKDHGIQIGKRSRSSSTSATSTKAAGSFHKNYNIDTSEFTPERCEQLEAAYWKTLTYAEPMYGADSLGSLFSSNVKSWNVANLPNILDLMDTRLPGVNDAYLYAGLWKATFSWHLEDQDLYSINYLHFGAPKQWYSIPQEQASKFYELMKEEFPEDSRQCSEFLRHKTFMMSPTYLAKHGIQCNKIVHNEGEYIITYPYGYHSGFNFGYNLAESVNFALDDWFQYGKVTKKCECINDSVGINVDHLYCKFMGIPYEHHLSKNEDNEDANLDVVEQETIEDQKESTVKLTKKKVKQNRKPPSSSKSPELPKVTKPDFECHLCPNNLPKILQNMKLFQLIDIDSTPYRAHRICAEQLNGLSITEQKDTLDKVAKNQPEPQKTNRLILRHTIKGISSVTQAQRNLKCGVCNKRNDKSKPQHGVCFQCVHPKCVRAYHATCAISDGVLFGETEEGNTCKFHRNKTVFQPMNLAKFEKISRIPIKSIIQFSLVKPITTKIVQPKELFSGLITGNFPEESLLHVNIYPHLRESLEVSYENLLINGDDGHSSTVDNSFLIHTREAKKISTRKKTIKEDRTVTGLEDVNLTKILDDPFNIVESLLFLHRAPSVTQDISNGVFWHYIHSASTDVVARYSNNIKSDTPNDANYLKQLDRKLKRKFDGNKFELIDKKPKFINSEFKQQPVVNGHFLPRQPPTPPMYLQQPQIHYPNYYMQPMNLPNFHYQPTHLQGPSAMQNTMVPIHGPTNGVQYVSLRQNNPQR
ncbi:DNA damage-responsive transcriptional repressor Rph1p [[Candida] anglica]|uniref:[histone H3]-trimethyl-L-lysine(9) demethylase n=1 Tax=[Candida] anglica TaxID=148631 RepID=A0ABP0EBD7_9ASCO